MCSGHSSGLLRIEGTQEPPGNLAEKAGSDAAGVQSELRFQISNEVPGGTSAAGP